METSLDYSSIFNIPLVSSTGIIIHRRCGTNGFVHPSGHLMKTRPNQKALVKSQEKAVNFTMMKGLCFSHFVTADVLAAIFMNVQLMLITWSLCEAAHDTGTRNTSFVLYKQKFLLGNKQVLGCVPFCVALFEALKSNSETETSLSSGREYYGKIKAHFSQKKKINDMKHWQILTVSQS